MARILLGVSGGIAAYKACEVCRLLVRAGHDVIPLVTPGAERFVTAETFRALAQYLTGRAETTPWDSELSPAMRAANVAVHEEAIVDLLLADLAG